VAVVMQVRHGDVHAEQESPEMNYPGLHFLQTPSR
jgi:hypothetical protein